MPDLLDFMAACEARDAAIATVAASAEEASPGFAERAAAFVLERLAAGPESGEELTLACKRAGIVPWARRGRWQRVEARTYLMNTRGVQNGHYVTRKATTGRDDRQGVCSSARQAQPRPNLGGQATRYQSAHRHPVDEGQDANLRSQRAPHQSPNQVIDASRKSGAFAS